MRLAWPLVLASLMDQVGTDPDALARAFARTCRRTSLATGTSRWNFCGSPRSSGRRILLKSGHDRSRRAARSDDPARGGKAGARRLARVRSSARDRPARFRRRPTLLAAIARLEERRGRPSRTRSGSRRGKLGCDRRQRARTGRRRSSAIRSKTSARADGREARRGAYAGRGIRKAARPRSVCIRSDASGEHR